jgi:hypothetical protein
MSRVLFFLIISFSLQISAAAPEIAVVYEVGNPVREILYKYSREKNPKGGITAWFKTPDGKIYAEEEITQTGADFRSYKLTLPLLGESAEIRVADSKIYMSYSTPKGTKTETEDWKPGYVIGPTLLDYIQANWDSLQAGESVRVRMLVPDRLESFGFRFKKIGTQKLGDRTVDKIHFEPTNIFIGMMVKPIVFLMEPNTRQALQISGKTYLKKKVPGGWDDFLAETLFLNR